MNPGIYAHSGTGAGGPSGTDVISESCHFYFFQLALTGACRLEVLDWDQTMPLVSPPRRKSNPIRELQGEVSMTSHSKTTRTRLALNCLGFGSFVAPPPLLLQVHTSSGSIFRAADGSRFAMKVQFDFFVALALLVVLTNSQCYYPSGDPSKEKDVPCSSAPGSPCCPDGWQCLSNGLCYLDYANYFGRYTCTDKSWKSSGCPNICTHSKNFESIRHRAFAPLSGTVLMLR